MKKFQTVVQELLHNHERQRRYIALLTALCMLMAFTVSIVLIEPAESMSGELACGMTEHIHNENCFTYTCGLEDDENHVHSAECRKLTCGKTEHAHSENCYIEENGEMSGDFMQISSPEIFDDKPMAIADNIPENEPSAQSDNNLWFDSPPASKEELNGGNAHNIGDATVSVSGLKIDGQEISKGTDKKYHYTTTGDQAKVEFVLDYKFESIQDFSGWLYYQLPDGIVPDDNFFGEYKKVVETDGQDSTEIGYYSINKNGFIAVRFKPEFIQRVKDSGGKLEGYLQFSGSTSRKDTADGDRNFQIGKDEIIIDFPDKSFSVTKSGEAVVPETVGDTPKVKWTITVKDLATEDRKNVLSDYTLKDERLVGKSIDDLTISPNKDVVKSLQNGVITFKDNLEGNVTISFEDDLTEENLTNFNQGKTANEENTATLVDKEDNTVSEDKATVTFENQITMKKTGTPNYVDEYIEWKVDISRNFNQSLKGYTVQDEAIKNNETIIVKNGETELQEGTDKDYTLDKSSGTITFNKDFTDVSITYRQNKETFKSELTNASGTIHNTANLIPPLGETTPPQQNVTGETTWNEPLTLTKDGTYDRLNDKIDWEIKVSSGNDSYSLDGYTITDEVLKDIKLSEINVKNITYGYDNSIEILEQTEEVIVLGKNISWENRKEEYIKITKNGDTLKFEDVKKENSSRSLTITYSTEVTPEMKENAAAGAADADKFVENTATDSKGHDVTKGVDIVPENKAEKIPLDDSSQIVYSTTAKTKEFHWQIDLTQDLGFKDKILTDVMTVVDNSELSHYITKAQRGEILIQYEDAEGKLQPLPTGDYTIKFYNGTDESSEIEKDSDGNATRFKITFNEATDTIKYRHIRITYATTADIEHLVVKQQATFMNHMEFNEQVKEPTYTVEKRDPDDVTKHTLKVHKDWSGVTSEPVQFCLQRSLDNTNWETYNVSTKEWEPNITEFSNNYLITLDVSSQEIIYENLEEHQIGQPDNKYTYRVTEVLTETQKKLFNVSYSENKILTDNDNSNIITVTNSKKPQIDKKVDSSAVKDGKISVDKLIEDGDYYYIPYEIICNDKSGNFGIIDIIPNGFELAYDPNYKSSWSTCEYDESQHQPYLNGYYMEYRSGITESTNDSIIFNYEYDGVDNKALFLVNSSTTLKYQIKIKKSDLQTMLETAKQNGEELTITNEASLIGAEDVTASVDLTITGEVEQTTPEDNTLLKKGVTGENSSSGYVESLNGNIEYYVYVNPHGQKLSNTDYFDVIDDFTLKNVNNDGSYLTYTANQLREMFETGLLRISVEEISDFNQDSDGNITCTTGRNIDNFTYTIEENPSTSKKENVTYKFVNQYNEGMQYFTVAKLKNTSPLFENEKIEVEVTLQNPIESDTVNLKYEWNELGYAGAGSNILTLTKNGNKYIGTLTVPAGGADTLGISIDSNTKFSATASIKNKTVVTYDATSRLTINVPDETPLKITYKYIVTKEGNVLPKDTIFNASNKVSINTENVSSEDSLNNVEFKIADSGSGATTGGNPSIRKFNVGTNANLEGAKFYIAKYENGKWHFVNNITETIDRDKTLHKLEYSNDGIEGEGLPDSNKEYIDLSTTDKYELTGSSLQSGTLYKIIEVKAPSGYQGEGDGTLFREGKGYASLEALLKAYLADPTSITDSSEYYNLVQRFVAVHYFKYGTTASTEIKKPTNFSGNIMDVKSGGTISIPNNELIDIHATKTWVGSEGTSVTFELLWSTKKQSSGIPDDATAVTAEALGLIGNFNNERTIPEAGKTEATWNGLPNGLNDRPVYYYVREKSYTTSDNKVYERQDDGTYKCGDELGTYKPTYTGNGLNKDGTVTVTNSNGLVIQKTWLKSDKNPMEDGEIPADKIKCNIYGKVSSNSEKVLIEKDVILEKPNWKYEPTGEKLAKYSQYDYIIIEETEVHLTTDSAEPDKWTSVDVALYGYVRSSTSNVTDGVGTATLINRDNTPTDVDVSVEKVWSDGNGGHSDDSIEVTLYESTTSISDADLANITNPESDERLTKVTFTGSQNANITLNAGNSWTYTWNDLPYKSETGQRYYYYVLETTGKNGYTASYFVNGNKTTITNSVPGSLTIDKKWLSTDGTDITSTITDEVNFKLYRRANSSAAADEDKKLDNLKIYAFGDSITYGVDVEENGANTDRYSVVLENLLKENYENITVNNSSQSGHTIEQIQKYEIEEAKIKLDSSYNVVIVLAGTNNVLNGTDTKSNQPVDEMITAMESLINKVYELSTKEDLIVLVGKIPRIIYDGGDDPGHRGEIYNTPALQKQAFWNKWVNDYNTALEKFVTDYSSEYSRNVRIVDTYTAVGDNLTNSKTGATMGSGIHPDKVGHLAMAQAFYNAILEAYNINSKVPVGVNGLPSDFYKSDGTVNTLYEEVTGKAFTLSSEKGWSETIKDLDKKDTNGNDYVYYIVEESTGNWTAAYTGNGQIIGNEGATITVTNTIDKGSIDVEKVWKNANGSEYTPNAGDTVEVQLYRSTTPPTSPISNIMNEPMALAEGTKGYVSGDNYCFPIDSDNAVLNGNKLIITITGDERLAINKNGEIYFDNDFLVQKGLSDATVLKSNITGATWGWLFGVNEGTSKKYDTPPKLSDFTTINIGQNGFSVNAGSETVTITLTLDNVAGGTTEETNPPTQTHGEKTLSFGNGAGDTSKIAQITGANIGDKIIVHLAKDAIQDGAKGSFGYSIDDSEHDNWCNYTWNYNNNVISGIATVDVAVVDSQVEIGTDGDDITFTWTVTDDWTKNLIQFQIWDGYIESNLSSATYTIQNSTTTEPVDPEPTDSHIPEGAIKVDEYTLKSTDNWKHTFKDLPLTDASGNPYYYYVKEVNVPDGFEVTYSDGVEPGGTITITNTKKESSTTTMPSTGGNGARKYYTVGGMLLLMSACGWAMHRRKRVIPH